LKTEGGFQWRIEKLREGGVFLLRRRTEKERDWSINEKKPGYQESSNHVP
jgi:hypothetical protein